MINYFNTKIANINIFNEYLIRHLQVPLGVNDYKIQQTNKNFDFSRQIALFSQIQERIVSNQQQNSHILTFTKCNWKIVSYLLHPQTKAELRILPRKLVMLMMIRARRVVLCLLATLSLARRLRLNVGLFFLSFDGLLGKHKQPPYTQWAKNMDHSVLQ